MKLYASKSGAQRALKSHVAKHGGKVEDYNVVESMGKFGFLDKDGNDPVLPEEKPKTKAKQKPKAKAPGKGKAKKPAEKPKAKAKAAKPKAKAAKQEDIRRASEIENPVQHVWNVCEEMYAADNNVRRRDILARLDGEGVAFYTARTQYQRWYAARKASEQPAKKAEKAA